MKPCPLPTCGAEGVRIKDRGETQCVRCGFFAPYAAWDALVRVPPVRSVSPTTDDLAAFVRLAISGAQDALRAYERGDPAGRAQLEGALLTQKRALDEVRKSQQLTLVG